MNFDCIFCNLIKSGKCFNPLGTEVDYVCINDLHPQAPVHVLIIPKVHISSLMYVSNFNSFIVKQIFEDVPRISELLGIESFRLVVNTGVDAGQTVNHLHFHLMGGRSFDWPPG